MEVFLFLSILFQILFIGINSQEFKPNLNELYIPVDPDYMQSIISNLTTMLDSYVYLDIIKNPPNNLHDKIDLKQELNEINTSEQRPFYEFYRDFRKITTKVKDIHLLSLVSFQKLSYYIAYIPFLFYICKDNNNNYKICLKQRQQMLNIQNNYDDYMNNFINEAMKDNIYIDLINNIDPFDFIQNFGEEYSFFKNSNAKFTAMISYISNIPLFFFPLNETELKLNIKLSNGLEQNISYIYVINKDLPLFSNTNDVKNDDIDWDYQTSIFKCKVDHNKQMNIFQQTSFSSDDNEDIYGTIYNCTKLFHENNYPIIGIEKRNLGGDGRIGVYLRQLLQPKISSNNMLFSLRKNDLLKNNFENIKKDNLDFSTCKPPESYEKLFREKPDNYGNDTFHYRTILLDEINLEFKTDLHKKRKEMLDTKKTRKPTDIIIFTDYLSVSATSIFIKGFQETGGAIVVGYFGNPLERNKKYDAAISSSGVSNLEWTPYCMNLARLNFTMGITFQEFYQYDYQKENPIPQEYITIPVDEHVDIYEDFDINSYDKFIEEAKKIFDKYNNKNECNKNNNLLLFESDKCYNLNNYAHGGYSCGNDGKWNNSDCQPFYCDLGYYYDTYQQKCVEDLCLKKESNKEEAENKFPTYLIVIIVLAAIIAIIIVIIIIIKFRRRNLDSNDKIEDISPHDGIGKDNLVQN